MSYTPVQALQLLHGVESPANSSNPNKFLHVTSEFWERAQETFRSVLNGVLEGNPGLFFENLALRRGADPWKLPRDGAVLVFVEGFEPTITQGYSHPSPYWPNGPDAGYVPYINVRRSPGAVSQPSPAETAKASVSTDLRELASSGIGVEEVERKIHDIIDKRPDQGSLSLMVYRHLMVGGGASGSLHYPNPNNTPGNIERWRDDWKDQSGRPVDALELYQGDALFSIGEELDLEVDGAQVANVWIVGFGDPSSGATFVTASPERSGSSSRPDGRVFSPNSAEAGDIALQYKSFVEKMKGTYPPVLYLARRPIVNDSILGGSISDPGREEVPKFEFINRFCEGMMLCLVEGFEPEEHAGATGALRLMIQGDSDEHVRTILFCRRSDDSKPVWLKLGAEPIHLARGDLLFIMESTVTLTISEADTETPSQTPSVAYLRIAGFGPPRPDSCGGRPC